MRDVSNVGQTARSITAAGRGSGLEDAGRIAVHFQIEVAVATQDHQVDAFLLQLGALIEIDEGFAITPGVEGRKRTVGEDRHLKLGGALAVLRRLGGRDGGIAREAGAQIGKALAVGCIFTDLSGRALQCRLEGRDRLHRPVDIHQAPAARQRVGRLKLPRIDGRRAAARLTRTAWDVHCLHRWSCRANDHFRPRLQDHAALGRKRLGRGVLRRLSRLLCGKRPLRRRRRDGIRHQGGRVFEIGDPARPAGPGALEVEHALAVAQLLAGDDKAIGGWFVIGFPGKRRLEPARRGLELVEGAGIPAELLRRRHIFPGDDLASDAVQHVFGQIGRRLQRHQVGGSGEIGRCRIVRIGAPAEHHVLGFLRRLAGDQRQRQPLRSGRRILLGSGGAEPFLCIGIIVAAKLVPAEQQRIRGKPLRLGEFFEAGNIIGRDGEIRFVIALGHEASGEVIADRIEFLAAVCGRPLQREQRLHRLVGKQRRSLLDRRLPLGRIGTVLQDIGVGVLAALRPLRLDEGFGDAPENVDLAAG
uniref:CelE1 n=1 Tax=Rhizobium leguminosarum TaxID=384 RepID=Q4VK23_RHILE|nr:CelE1 [Rhizobium leguminosarum]